MSYYPIRAFGHEKIKKLPKYSLPGFKKLTVSWLCDITHHRTSRVCHQNTTGP